MRTRDVAFDAVNFLLGKRFGFVRDLAAVSVQLFGTCYIPIARMHFHRAACISRHVRDG